MMLAKVKFGIMKMSDFEKLCEVYSVFDNEELFDVGSFAGMLVTIDPIHGVYEDSRVKTKNPNKIQVEFEMDYVSLNNRHTYLLDLEEIYDNGFDSGLEIVKFVNIEDGEILE